MRPQSEYVGATGRRWCSGAPPFIQFTEFEISVCELPAEAPIRFWLRQG